MGFSLKRLFLIVTLAAATFAVAAPCYRINTRAGCFVGSIGAGVIWIAVNRSWADPKRWSTTRTARLQARRWVAGVECTHSPPARGTLSQNTGRRPRLAGGERVCSSPATHLNSCASLPENRHV